jgi:hypothetical protein
MPARDTLNPKALAFFLSVSGFISTVKAVLYLGSFFWALLGMYPEADSDTLPIVITGFLSPLGGDDIAVFNVNTGIEFTFLNPNPIRLF